MNTVPTQYKFKVGDKVQHIHQGGLEGTIKKCTTYGEVGDDIPGDCDDQPWYKVRWDTVPDEERPYTGHESEDVLSLI
jgi:hypothetical protein